MLLADIDQKIRLCTKCALCNSKKNYVPGCGPQNAEVVFVSDAPKPADDNTSIPMSGDQGALFDSYLDFLGLDSESVFITQAVKCRAPKDRKPKKKELDTCLPYFYQQVESIKPKLVIILGELAFNAIFQDCTFAKCRGDLLTKHDVMYSSTYHPGHALRVPTVKIDIVDDLKRIREYLTQLGVKVNSNF